MTEIKCKACKDTKMIEDKGCPVGKNDFMPMPCPDCQHECEEDHYGHCYTCGANMLKDNKDEAKKLAAIREELSSDYSVYVIWEKRKVRFLLDIIDKLSKKIEKTTDE